MEKEDRIKAAKALAKAEKEAEERKKRERRKLRANKTMAVSLTKKSDVSGSVLNKIEATVVKQVVTAQGIVTNLEI